MKNGSVKFLVLAVVCFLASCVFWAGALDMLLGYIGIHWGKMMGIALVIVVNIFHYKFGWFHPDTISANTARSVFYGDYLYVKIISFLTIGPSLYLARAKGLYQE